METLFLYQKNSREDAMKVIKLLVRSIFIMFITHSKIYNFETNTT